MGEPANYFIDPASGTDDMMSSGAVDSAWKTVQFALEEGIDGPPEDEGYPRGHDANGVQLNIKATPSAGATIADAASPIDIAVGYPNASSITHAAPLIFRGYQTAAGDWYPGKSGDVPALYGYHYPGVGRTDYPIVSDAWDSGTPSAYSKVSDHILFYDLEFNTLGSHPHVTLNSACSFVNCRFKGGSADTPIQVTADNTFVNCHFRNMGSPSGSGHVTISHSGSGLTLVNCIFDFLADTTPYACIKTLGTGSHHLTGNVFMCTDGVRVMNWSGTPSGADAGLMVLINNTFYSDASPPENPFVGSNVPYRYLALDNLTEGWAVGIVLKPENNVLAWGGNSAYNNDLNFPDGTDPDVWFEFAGGNFTATDANSNKTLAQSPFLDATSKIMSCRPARTSEGDEAVVGQGVALHQEPYGVTNYIVKRGDRGAVPRGPLTTPVGVRGVTG